MGAFHEAPRGAVADFEDFMRLSSVRGIADPEAWAALGQDRDPVRLKIPTFIEPARFELLSGVRPGAAGAAVSNVGSVLNDATSKGSVTSSAPR